MPLSSLHWRLPSSRPCPCPSVRPCVRPYLCPFSSLEFKALLLTTSMGRPRPPGAARICPPARIFCFATANKLMARGQLLSGLFWVGSEVKSLKFTFSVNLVLKFLWPRNVTRTGCLKNSLAIKYCQELYIYTYKFDGLFCPVSPVSLLTKFGYWPRTVVPSGL